MESRFEAYGSVIASYTLILRAKEYKICPTRPLHAKYSTACQCDDARCVGWDRVAMVTTVALRWTELPWQP